MLINVNRVMLAFLMIGLVVGVVISPVAESTVSDLPSTIRIKRLELDRIDTVDFKLYTKRVLPQEWIASWSEESLKAGAMAVKTFAWYWIDQGGRHLDADVCDGTHCQVYKEETHPRTDNAVETTWLIGMMKDGELFESQYWDGLAVVDYTGGIGLNIRSSPEINDNIITAVPEGAELAIVDNEPIYADNYHWWDVVTEAGQGQRGWATGEFLRSRWPTYEGETLNEYADRHNLEVRMSQYGSMYLANQDWDFREILSYYYPGIEFFDISAALPDLIVDDIWTEPTEFNPGDMVKIYIRIKNIGNGDAVSDQGLWIKAYFDGSKCYEEGIEGLGAGANTGDALNWTYQWPSDTNWHTIKVVVDPDNFITESNEENNERSEQFKAVGPANQPPTCSLSANPTSGNAPLTVTFSMSASDPDGSISSWKLDVNNDGIAEYSGSGNPPSTKTHTYQNPGSYIAKLMVTDDDGSTATYSMEIKVEEEGGIPGFELASLVAATAIVLLWKRKRD